MEIDLSICIPMYNCEEYIVSCLQSIHSQIHGENVEIIIIDDCSTDRSKEKVEQFIKDNRMNVKIFTNPQNSGVAYSRNISVKRANGKYVMFLDSDDNLENDFLENVYEIMESNQFDMILWGFNEVDEHMKLKKQMRNCKGETIGIKICEQLSKYNFQIRIGSYMIRREILLDHNIQVSSKYKYGEDQELNYKCLLHSGKVKVLDKCFYNYRYNPTSAMNVSRDFRRFDTVESRKDLLQYMKENFNQEKELIDRFQNFLIPEAIVTVTRVLVYTGIDKKTLKQYLDKQGYIELLKKATKEGKLSTSLRIELLLQTHAWILYNALCKIRKYRKG